MRAVASTNAIPPGRHCAFTGLWFAVALTLAGCLFMFGSPGHARAAGVTYTSLRGVDRYETAVKISKTMFPAGLPAGAGVVLAPGETFPEALCGAPLAMRDLMQAYAGAVGAKIAYLKDSSRNGYSDHEPFELSGFPAAWLEWREDLAYHTAGDTYAHCSAACVERAGKFALGFLADLDVGDLYNLRAAKY